MSALARNLNHLFARRFRTLAFVTRSGTDMSAQLPRRDARLRALLSGSLARPGVTYGDALVPSARQRLVAR